jgi:hypothetical protein
MGITFSFPNGEQTACGGRLGVQLHVRNRSASDLVLNSATRRSGADLQKQLTLGPLPTEEIPSGKTTTLSVQLSRPPYNGYYKDALTITATDHGDTPFTASGILAYKVTGTCVTLITPAAFQNATDVRLDYAVQREGATRLIQDTSGPTRSATLPLLEPQSALVLAEIPAMRDDDEGGAVSGSRPVDITYCIRVTYYDDFQSCPADTTGMFWWRPYCSDSKSVNFHGLVLELYDQDDTSSDDYIGSFATNYSDADSYSCVSFTWDPSLRGEDFPELYVRTEFQVADSEFSSPYQGHLCAKDDSGGGICTEQFGYTWRSTYEPNAQGTVFADKYFGTATNVWNQRAMQMASLQKFLRTFQGVGMAADLNVLWDGDHCDDEDGNPWSCTINATWIQLGSQHYQRWDAAAHEAGHAYQMQLLLQPFALPGEACPSVHSLTVASNADCATREGWAEFVSVITWFGMSSEKDKATPYLNWVAMEGSDSVSTSCTTNANTEAQVARAFWDLFDSNADGDDTASIAYSRWDLTSVWKAFPPGADNAESGEEVNSNMRDYHHNALSNSALHSDIWTILQKHGLDCQTWDP